MQWCKVKCSAVKTMQLSAVQCDEEHNGTSPGVCVFTGRQFVPNSQLLLMFLHMLLSCITGQCKWTSSVRLAWHSCNSSVIYYTALLNLSFSEIWEKLLSWWAEQAESMVCSFDQETISITIKLNSFDNYIYIAMPRKYLNTKPRYKLILSVNC